MTTDTNERPPMSLGEAFPIEQARVRELLEQYVEIGAPGIFGAHMIRQVLGRAEHAAISGDVVAMIRSFEELRGCK